MLFCMARERFLSEGYVQIGMDHFALPEDELALAVGKRPPHPPRAFIKEMNHLGVYDGKETIIDR